MIPKHLQGKNAEQILSEVSMRIFSSSSNMPCGEYLKKLEEVAILAIKDALCNADDVMQVKELVEYVNDGPEQRAVIFLNTVLPGE